METSEFKLMPPTYQMPPHLEIRSYNDNPDSKNEVMIFYDKKGDKILVLTLDGKVIITDRLVHESKELGETVRAIQKNLHKKFNDGTK